MKSGRVAAIMVLLPALVWPAVAAKEKARKKPTENPAAAAAEPAPAGGADKEAKEDPGLKGLTWRQVGPFRGGRALAVAGVPGDPTTFYFGGVGGGVWKTTDAGQNWAPIADKDKIVSVGAIAVAPSDANVIYVGTGEACIRGNILRGDGVYKSTDAGKNWSFMGLRETRHIGRMIVHPRNPDVVFVAALGHAYGPNPERGVFRSRDGGKTWDKVLFKDEDTGAIDISFDPSNPSILFAALWQVRRYPWDMVSGGPGSGLYRSGDGGASWKRLEGEGLPEGMVGRIGVAVSPNPNRVWALIEADKGGLYRSDDGGEKWRLINDDRNFRQRAWYYTHIFADPKNADTVYILNTSMWRSIDGGKTFTRIRAPHGDQHGLWIDPTDPRRMINANDGGADISLNGGESWTAQDNQPTAQFYHVITDNRFPYWIYGAQQDNTTVGIASRSDHGVIDRSDWNPVGGGESGYIASDPRDPLIVYAGSYGGFITRLNQHNHQEQDINPWPLNPIGHGAEDQKYRFQWTAPIVISAHDPNVIYHGAQKLLKSTDEGRSWVEISPDLTRNDRSKQKPAGGPITKDNTGVEVYDTIYSVAESPREKGLIWVGTDDGLVQITRNGGGSWSNVTPKDMPEWSRISLVEASPQDAGAAYVAVDRHELDDWAPLAYKTADYGASWKRIQGDLPAGAVVRAVREDPVRRDLLFAATEIGVFFSLDGGAHWRSLQRNLPASSMHDLVVKDNDLVVATHGRAFWVLDDIGPLRQMATSAPGEVTLYKPSLAHRMHGPGFQIPGAARVGQNPPAGAVIYYYLPTALKPEQKKEEGARPAQVPEETRKEMPKEEAAPGVERIRLEVLDGKGQVIRRYPPPKRPGEAEGAASEEEEFFFGPRAARELPAEAGLNRFVWDLRYEEATRVPKAVIWGGGLAGPAALPGNYQVRLTVEGKSYTQPLEIKMDPRVQASPADLEKQFDLLLKIRDQLSATHDAINQMRDVRRQVEDLNKRLARDPRGRALTDAGKRLDNRMKPIEEELIQAKSKSSQDVLNYPVKLNNELSGLASAVASADAAPTRQEYEVFDELSQQINAQLAQWRQVVNQDLRAYNDLVRKEEVPAIVLQAPGRAAESPRPGGTPPK